MRGGIPNDQRSGISRPLILSRLAALNRRYSRSKVSANLTSAISVWTASTSSLQGLPNAQPGKPKLPDENFKRHRNADPINTNSNALQSFKIIHLTLRTVEGQGRYIGFQEKQDGEIMTLMTGLQ